jgi:hypothetical protein
MEPLDLTRRMRKKKGHKSQLNKRIEVEKRFEALVLRVAVNDLISFRLRQRVWIPVCRRRFRDRNHECTSRHVHMTEKIRSATEFSIWRNAYPR